MKHYWLNKRNNEKLILFFNGWGMDEKSVQHLNCDDFDVLVFFDYRTLQTDANIWNEINSYSEIYLAGWSMGVMISSIFAERISNIVSKIAIAGTLLPIDDAYGIPVKIYELTANNFNDLSRKKFLRKMFAVDDSKFINRDTPALKDELIALQGVSAMDVDFDKAIIPLSDKIIPVQNQINFWQAKSQTKIVQLQCGHYPFFEFKSWKEIIL